jgi:hypothetical protein
LLFDRSQRRSPESVVREMGRGRLRVGARPRGTAGRPRGEPGRAGRRRSQIQSVTVFSAGVSCKSAKQEAARALVAYLTSAETGEAKRRHGMEAAGGSDEET